jgi:hypothetical protein
MTASHQLSNCVSVMMLPIHKLQKMCAMWVETAHEEFTDLPGRDPTLYLEIMAILKKCGKPPRWSTRSAVGLFLQSSDSEKAKDPSVNPKNAKGQYYCHMCDAWGKHSTDHCNQFKNLKQRVVQQKIGQAPDRRGASGECTCCYFNASI